MIHPEENLENGNPKCYICTDENIPLYKICSCADSFLCIECLEITDDRMNQKDNNNENKFKCPICRQNLYLEYHPTLRYFKKLTLHLGIRILFILVDFFPLFILHNYVKTDYPTIFFTSSDNFLYLSTINILLFRNTTKFLLTTIYKIDNHKITFFYGIDIFFSILTLCLFTFCFIKSSFHKVDLYAFLVLIFNYQFCFTIVWLMFTLDKLGKLISELKYRYQKYRIVVKTTYIPLVDDSG